MQVSVVICGYDPELSNHLIKAAESILNQSYADVQVVIVVDGSEQLYREVDAKLGDNHRVRLHCNYENLGLSVSRNVGIELATGDVVAFMDDDAVARENWVAELVGTYNRQDAIAAGGRMAPQWLAGKPEFLPEEFYWLIGVTHRGFPTEEQAVRNTFGSNISFRREVLIELGGFNPELGRIGDKQIQGEETELAARMADRYGEQVWFNPDAVVEHKIFDTRTDPIWLLKRAFWQGYSKQVMSKFVSENGGGEGEFLSRLLTKFIPQRVISLFQSPSVKAVTQLLMLILLSMMVGSGYLFSFLMTYRTRSDSITDTATEP